MIMMTPLMKSFRTGMYYPEASPWKRSTIVNASHIKEQAYGRSEIKTDMRVNEKRKSIGVDASLGANILGGLITATASASYMNDVVKEDNEVAQPFLL